MHFRRYGGRPGSFGRPVDHRPRPAGGQPTGLERERSRKREPVTGRKEERARDSGRDGVTVLTGGGRIGTDPGEDGSGRERTGGAGRDTRSAARDMSTGGATRLSRRRVERLGYGAVRR